MDYKSLLKKLLSPPLWVMILLALVCIPSLTMVFVMGLEEHPVAYILYVLSFYTLSVFCLFFYGVLPSRYKMIKSKVYEHPIGNRYLTDAVFRTHVSLYMSLGINLIYVGVNLISFFLYRSMWFIVLGLYYIILAAMRFLLVRYVRVTGIGKNRIGELRRTLLCSSILLSVNFALTGAVLMILYQNKGYNYHGILIYVMASYTFYITTHAIIDLIKYRKYNSPVMLITKVISLSAALVSMLSLETAMLTQFGAEMAPENRWLMIALTGAGVSITVITMSVFMIIKSARELSTLRESGGK